MLIVLFTSSPSTPHSGFTRNSNKNFILLNNDNDPQYIIYKKNPSRIVAVMSIDVFFRELKREKENRNKTIIIIIESLKKNYWERKIKK